MGNRTQSKALIDLRPMTEKGFEGFKTALIEDYAQDIALNYRLPLEKARASSARQIDSLLNAGLSTPNHFLYAIVSDEQTIGALWIEVDEQKKECFICEIQIHPEQRGKGWGKNTLQLLEERMRAQGIERIVLNVFAHNTLARELYEKMGYQVTNMTMQKWLTEAD
jgi:ribosomal protein S18 acetylase RimI-like enzyme